METKTEKEEYIEDWIIGCIATAVGIITALTGLYMSNHMVGLIGAGVLGFTAISACLNKATEKIQTLKELNKTPGYTRGLVKSIGKIAGFSIVILLAGTGLNHLMQIPAINQIMMFAIMIGAILIGFWRICIYKPKAE